MSLDLTIFSTIKVDSFGMTVHGESLTHLLFKTQTGITGFLMIILGFCIVVPMSSRLYCLGYLERMKYEYRKGLHYLS